MTILFYDATDILQLNLPGLSPSTHNNHQIPLQKSVRYLFFCHQPMPELISLTLRLQSLSTPVPVAFALPNEAVHAVFP